MFSDYQLLRERAMKESNETRIQKADTTPPSTSFKLSPDDLLSIRKRIQSGGAHYFDQMCTYALSKDNKRTNLKDAYVKLTREMDTEKESCWNINSLNFEKYVKMLKVEDEAYGYI